MLILRALMIKLPDFKLHVDEFYKPTLTRPYVPKWKLIAYWAYNARYGDFMLINNVIRIKQQFRWLNFYSMPTSILFVVKKRLNFVFTAFYILGLLFFSIL